MKIYVVRHGQTDINIQKRMNGLNNEDLNEVGVKQAKQLGKILENIDYDFIISSPLLRAKTTSELINVKDKPIIYDDRLLERDAGIYTKQLIESFDSYDWWSINPIEDFHDAESLVSLLKRTREFLDEIINKYNDKNIILVTHGGTSKAIQSYFCSISEDENLHKYKHNNCEIKEFNIEK